MRAAVIIGLVLLAPSAYAQEGMYVGLGLANFTFKESSAYLAPAPFDGTASSWKVYGGFEFTEHFGMEVRYGGTDKIGQPFSGTDPNGGAFAGTITTDFKTTSAVAMASFPRDWGALIGGVGYFSIDQGANLELNTDCCGFVTDSTSVNDNGLMGVLGVEWRFGRFGTGIGVRLEYEWMDITGADGSSVGVGISYRF